MANTAKRILSIAIKRVDDESPDTSYYGEYSNTRSSRFSIDRKHSVDCKSVNPSNDATVEQLERAISYLDKQRNFDVHSEQEDLQLTSLGESQDILIDAQEQISECDCDEHGDMGRGEYRYFNPSFNYVDDKGEIKDGLTEDEVRKYVSQDYKRMESLNSGGWSYIGIRAVAKIVVNGTEQAVTSGGLYGIESDSSGDDFKEIESEQLGELRETLHEMGFSKRAIATAVKELIAA